MDKNLNNTRKQISSQNTREWLTTWSREYVPETNLKKKEVLKEITNICDNIWNNNFYIKIELRKLKDELEKYLRHTLQKYMCYILLYVNIIKIYDIFYH